MHMLDDDAGMSSTMEFMLTFIIAAAIFSIFVMNSNALFLATPRHIVKTNQFNDVGNDVSIKIIDTYLVTPEDGIISTYFDIPSVVAGSTYKVAVRPAGMWDREVVVYDDNVSAGGVSVAITLNGAHTTVPINGTTASTDAQHGIVYRSLGGGH